MNKLRIIYNGLIAENPTFVLLLGMCPTLGTTGSAMTGMSMGLATTGVLICSNIAISAIKSLVPDRVRIPAYIVVIATFVTLLQMFMAAYLPELNASLGIFIPLIVVNCILLGRAEAYASKHTVSEILGVGTVFGLRLFPETFGSLVFVLAPGAFIALGFLIALINYIRNRS